MGPKETPTLRKGCEEEEFKNRDSERLSRKVGKR